MLRTWPSQKPSTVLQWAWTPASSRKSARNFSLLVRHWPSQPTLTSSSSVSNLKPALAASRSAPATVWKMNGPHLRSVRALHSNSRFGTWTCSTKPPLSPRTPGYAYITSSRSLLSTRSTTSVSSSTTWLLRLTTVSEKRQPPEVFKQLDQIPAWLLMN